MRAIKRGSLYPFHLLGALFPKIRQNSCSIQCILHGAVSLDITCLLAWVPAFKPRYLYDCSVPRCDLCPCIFLPDLLHSLSSRLLNLPSLLFSVPSPLLCLCLCPLASCLYLLAPCFCFFVSYLCQSTS